MKTRIFCAVALSCVLLAAVVCCRADDGTVLKQIYAAQVDRRLNVPDSEQTYYGDLLAETVADKNISAEQYFVLVDRSAFVQAVMIYWMSADRVFRFIGASPASTGRPGRFDHFLTPAGVFEHSIDNLDFRAEGTRNESGIRGYGIKGRRVFDFGWQQSEKGWGRGGEGTMRLQMHATDPDFLEKRLGTAQSKGCIRIPATLDVLLDRYGVLDADYETAMAEGKTFWVIPGDRQATRWSGRYLVIVDTRRTARPAWSIWSSQPKKISWRSVKAARGENGPPGAPENGTVSCVVSNVTIAASPCLSNAEQAPTTSR